MWALWVPGINFDWKILKESKFWFQNLSLVTLGNFIHTEWKI